MKKSHPDARIIVSPETLTNLRVDVAMRRRALAVNTTAYAVRHRADLLALSAPILGSVERTALAEVVATLGACERWTDAATRRLAAALTPVRRRAVRRGRAG